MLPGNAMITSRGTTTLSSVLELVNGVTKLGDGSGFAATGFTPTAISKASPAVVTKNAHGLVNGQLVRGTNFRASPVASATGMYGLNNQVFQVGSVTANTFALFYPNSAIPVDTSAEVTFVNNGIAKFNLVGQELNTQNPAPVYRYTLGTAVMGNPNDVIYIRAMRANQVIALGIVT